MVPVSCSLHYVSRRNEKYSKTGYENGCKLWTISKWLKKMRWLGLLNLKKKKKRQTDTSEGIYLIMIKKQKLLRRSIRNSCLPSNDTRTKMFDEIGKQYTFTQFVINLGNWLSRNISTLKSLRAFEKGMTFYLSNENIHS